MIEAKLIISTLLVIAVVVAIIRMDTVKVAFKGLRLRTANLFRKNSVVVKGNNSIISQGDSKNKTPAHNSARITGDYNNIKQQ